MTGNIWLAVLWLLPFIGALPLLFFSGKKAGYACGRMAVFTAAAEFLLSLILAVNTFFNGGSTCAISGVMGFGLTFSMEGFNAVYLVILSFMWMTAVFFSPEYMRGHENLRRYYLFTLLTLGATAGVFLSADLITLFLFFEIMSFTSYVWVAQEETRGALRAAGTYLSVAVLGGMVMLMGMFLLYHLTGTLSIAELRAACAAVKERGVLFAAGLMMLVGFGAKAGMFPLHIWLPKAHPVAPAPASALLSGVLTKAGILGIILLCGSVLFGEERFGFLVLVLGVITMFLGAVLGVFSVDLKRTFACSSVSQVGFILTGLGALNLLPEKMLAIDGAFLHMVNHSLIKLVLFLLAGIVYKNLHSLDFNEIRGFGKGKPFFFAAYVSAALAIGGMPLFSGYISKTLLHEAIVESAHMYGGGTHTLLVAAEWIFLVSGGMTVAYMLKVFFVLFVDSPAAKHTHVRESENYVSNPVKCLLAVPAVLFAVFGMLPGITMQKIAGWAEPFFNGGAFLEGKDAVHYFSLGNLKGALISIVIGVFLYFVFVRRFLCEKEEGGMYYKNCIPVWLDLEDGIYRPLCCYLLPLLFEVPCRLADGLVSEKFFVRILPFMLAVPCRILDKFVGGMVYVVNRTVFRQVREKEHVVMGDRLAYYAGSAADCISRIYRRVSKKGEKEGRSYVERFRDGEEKLSRTVRLVTRSVSYGLLLSCIGLLMTMLYLLME